MLSSTALPLLLVAALAAVAGHDSFLYDDYDDFYETIASSSTSAAPEDTSSADTDSTPPPSSPASTTSVSSSSSSSASTEADWDNSTSTTTPPTTTTTTTTTTTAPSTTTEGQDEKELHSLLGGHEGTKRAASTQAKGAATITKAMHTKAASTKTRDRSKNAFRQSGDGYDATNSIWNSEYNPTTPIDPDEEDLHFVKVITPFEMVTRGGSFVAPTEKTPDRGHRYQLTPELTQKLQKLDFYFLQLAILAEDCRRRLLCEVADQQLDFQPLSFVLMEESSFRGNYESVRPALMSTTEGARLLTYMEATASGRDRARGCSGFVYRCPTKAQDMVDMEALALWRDMVRWMSVQVVALRPTAT